MKIENKHRIIEILSEDATDFTHTVADLELDIDLRIKLNLCLKEYPILVIYYLQKCVDVLYPEIKIIPQTKLFIHLK